MGGGRGTPLPPHLFAFYSKVSLGIHTWILASLFVENAPMKKKIKKFSFTPHSEHFEIWVGKPVERVNFLTPTHLRKMLYTPLLSFINFCFKLCFKPRESDFAGRVKISKFSRSWFSPWLVKPAGSSVWIAHRRNRAVNWVNIIATMSIFITIFIIISQHPSLALVFRQKFCLSLYISVYIQYHNSFNEVKR